MARHDGNAPRDLASVVSDPVGSVRPDPAQDELCRCGHPRGHHDHDGHEFDPVRPDPAAPLELGARACLDSLVADIKAAMGARYAEIVDEAEGDISVNTAFRAALAAERQASKDAIEELKEWVHESDCCYGGSCVAGEIEQRLATLLKALPPVPAPTLEKK